VKDPVVTFIPETAPFDHDQRLWLNGYMAGLLAAKNLAVAATGDAGAPAPTVPLTILFGSQTGTAQGLAKRIAREIAPRGFNARVVDAADHGKVDWSKESHLLVVTSTYGDGDMPDNAQPFWDWLQTDAATPMARLNFSVLGLGDTNYEQFCAAGKKIDARLAELGAKRIHPFVDCDLDYEARAKGWIDGVFQALAPFTHAEVATAGLPDAPRPAAPLRETFSKTNPYPARLVTNRRLNGDRSEKETRHFEIALGDLEYDAGDALGVWPSNCPALVAEILAALRSDGEEAVPTAKGEMPLRKALTEFFDISRPSAELLKHCGERDDALRALLAAERREQLKQWLWGRGLVDLLADPSGRLTAKELVPLLKPLAPRLYSISSSPRAHAGQVHLTVNVVRYESFGRIRKGLASTFLADRAGDAPVPVFVQTSHGFRLPENPDAPVIMVGPGTGIAPFRAFLHDRRAIGAKGRNWLFFGEQRAALDFYYRDELEPMRTDGHLTKLSLAFSRDQKDKVYVQHRMLEQAGELWSWLEAGAHFYVCGDATRMAKDVDEALHKIVESAGGRSIDDAKAYVAKLKADKRYQRDVY